MKINIFYDEIDYRIRGVNKIKKYIEKVIRMKNRIPGDLNFIFTLDMTIVELNVRYLEHEYFTDVIAFDYSEKNVINGEVYISIDTVRRNAINYKVSLYREVLRVMIHGTLHLCGLNDKTESEREVMRKEEDKWLEKFVVE